MPLSIVRCLSGATAIFPLCLFCAAGETIATPRPEHPMPQMVRAEWLNLNGEWAFAETDDDADESFLAKETYPDRIVVPFCRESKLSGLERRGFVKNVWYRRTFTVPTGWVSPRVRLHIGACDWRTRVWVNGKLVGRHTGGSVAFAFDVTDALKAGENIVIIHAYDDTRSGLQATGKQSQKEESFGCVYTRTTGIWQTVWLEGVGASFIRDVFITPDPDNGRAYARVEIDGSVEGVSVEAAALMGGKTAATATAAASGRNANLTLEIAEKRLWSLDDPFLYDIKLVLKRGKEVLDTVNSYFGLRTVSIEGAAVLINHKPVFQRLVLDQGFYPEGIWTAPSDAALKRDIELSKAVGFNGARLHQKVFEPRFLYWADTLGYLVWGEFPNWGANVGTPQVDLPIHDEWLEIVQRDRNHPAIVGWCPFNETGAPSGPLQNAIVYATRQADPTRPVLDSSGYFHSLPDPALLDAHDYNQDPAGLRAKWENALGENPAPARYGGGNAAIGLPFFVSEYGGIGWNIHGKGWGYGNAPEDLEAFYKRFEGLSYALMDNRRMFAFCYTQLTDIEQEQNGIYTYQREAKFDTARLHAILSREAAYEKDPPTKKTASSPKEWKVIVGAVPDGEKCRPWRYVIETPAANWTDPAFDDAAWKTGQAGFGKKGGWEKSIRTPWTTKDIWLRQGFDYDGAAFGAAMLAIHYDNATEVYVNGQMVWSGTGWNDNYSSFDITETLRRALKPGKNLVAVHCHQDEGGQFIDLAVLVAEK